MRAWIAAASALVVAAALRVTMLWYSKERRRFREPKDPYFSKDYVEARAKFREAATAVGAKQQWHQVAYDSTKDVTLTIDTALVQRNPKTLIVHLSGVHGVEGFCGSAIQCALLRQLQTAPLDLEAPSILFVHAVNPYGFHFLRRFNETNVDLNRNFLLTDELWDKVRARDPNEFHYEDVSRLLNPGRALQWYEWYPTILWNLFKVRRFFSHIRKAVVTGQYHNPQGLYYGGANVEKSNAILRDLIQAAGESTEVAVCIDVHSGLGRSGEDTLMAGNTDNLVKNFPDLVFSGAGTGPVSAGYEDQLGGTTLDGVLPKARVALHVTQEFGTIPPVQVLWAMIFENAAYNYRPIWSDLRTWAAHHLRDAFYVSTDAWRASVLKRGVDLFERVETRMKKSDTMT